MSSKPAAKPSVFITLTLQDRSSFLVRPEEIQAVGTDDSRGASLYLRNRNDVVYVLERADEVAGMVKQ